MCRRLAIAAVAILTLATTAVARAPVWDHRVVVAREAAGELMEPYFVRSPGRRQVVLVDSGFDTRTRILVRREDGSFGRPIRVPSRPSVYSEAPVAVNDRGAMVFGWAADAPNAPADFEGDSCWCRAQAVVRRPDGRFGSIRTLSSAALGQGAVFPYVDARGRMSVFWISHRALRYAEALPSGRLTPARTVATRINSWDVSNDASGAQLLEWRTGAQWYAATQPFEVSREIPPPTYGGAFAVAFANDGHGHEVRVAAVDHDKVDITAAVRRVGGSFGHARLIAHAAPGGTLCDVGAAMNVHRRVFAVWDCQRGESGAGYARGAMLTRDGRVRSMSGRHAALSAGTYMGMDLDDHGHAVAVWQEPDYDDIVSLVATRGRIAGFRRVAHSHGMDRTSIGATIAPRGRALATWADSRYGRAVRIKVATIDLRGRR